MLRALRDQKFFEEEMGTELTTLKKKRVLPLDLGPKMPASQEAQVLGC